MAGQDSAKHFSVRTHAQGDDPEMVFQMIWSHYNQECYQNDICVNEPSALTFLLRRSFRGCNSKLLKLSSSLLTVNSLLHSPAGINLFLEVLFYLTRYPVQCWYRFRLKFSFSLHVVLLLVCSLLHLIPPNSSHITQELESEISLTTGKLTCQSVSTLSAWCLNEYTKFKKILFMN